MSVYFLTGADCCNHVLGVTHNFGIFWQNKWQKPQIYAAQFVHKLHHPQNTSNTRKNHPYAQPIQPKLDFLYTFANDTTNAFF